MRVRGSAAWNKVCGLCRIVQVDIIHLCGVFFFNFFVFYYSGSQEMLEKYMKKKETWEKKSGSWWIQKDDTQEDRWNWHSWEGTGHVGLVCMSGTTQWPRARSWHAIDTRLKLTLTPQIITFSLWKLALPSHSSHSVSVSLLSPGLFQFLPSPRLLWYIGERMVLTLKSNYLSFTCLFLSLW